MDEVEEPVSVLSVFEADKRIVRPLRLKWHGRVYTIKEIAMHFTKTIQGNLYHIYAVSCGGINFVLYLNTKTLFWSIKEMTNNE